ncbi:2,3-diaminopropionate biosynthesis protein SbnB [Sorangium sp. So ce119]|uniref:2,3-diaminopropionate biosynthesis protein SbnB n=1 Tax=Sorangium sp. So ce119 TaxID=3133279 RepID=UPI003F5E1DD7
MSEQRLLYLGRADVSRLSGASTRLYVDAVERALRLHAERKFVQPLKPYLRWRGEQNHVADRIIAMPAYLGGDRPAAGIKWIGSKHDNPAARGVERASALVVLNDTDSHYPIAILEGALISSYRTAAVTTVAARHLARQGFEDLACLGCGPIGRTQVDMVLEHFPAVRRVHLFDVNRAAAGRYADELASRPRRPEVVVAESAEAAVRAGELVITATVVDKPYLPHAWLRKGAFLSNVSIMDVHKEVFLEADKVVVDDWDQCNREKKVIHQLVEEGRFSRERLHAELGEVVAGARPGREDDREIILLNPMGMAVEDIACAQAVYQAAVDAGAGTWLPLC